MLRYVPDKLCLELKSYKMYLLAYRNLGIFQENVVNRVLQDVVAAAKPVSATVIGDFAPRGGLQSIVTATWSRKRVAEQNDSPRRPKNWRSWFAIFASACARAIPTHRTASRE